jgi:hypothetical protein
MKNLLAVFLLFTLFITSCSKNAGEQSPKSDLLFPDIRLQLAALTHLSNFNNAIKELSLTAEETAGGITVFAPQDHSIITFNGAAILHFAYTTEQLKDHIVKGKYTLADLRNKGTLTALSGKVLSIGRIENQVTINGIPVKEEAVVAGNSGIVHVLERAIDVVYPEPPGEIVVTTLTEAEFKSAFESVKSTLDAFQKSLVVMDALLSNEATWQQAQQAGYGQYRDFHGFQFRTNSFGVEDVWKKGYQVIGRVNALMRAQSETFNSKNELLAGLRTMRAYAYLRLLSYYGNLAISPEVFHSNTPAPSNTNKQAVLDYIYADLAAADVVLGPLGKAPEINTYTVKALTAKLALHEKNYGKVADYTGRIIGDEAYSLENKASVFDHASSEIIWKLESIPEGALKVFLNNRQALPILRLSEVHLMQAEAQLALKEPQLAAQSMSQLLERQELSGNSSEALLQSLWLKEMNREGISFVNRVRWGTAAQQLPGFNHARFNLLPIPERETQLSASIVQNFGYPY